MSLFPMQARNFRKLNSEREARHANLQASKRPQEFERPDGPCPPVPQSPPFVRQGTLDELRLIGPHPNVIQIVAPRHVYRPGYLRAEDRDNEELLTRPLASSTGPGGAKRFRNRGGSQIATPHVTNVYLGDFWGDRNFFEGFSKAIVENGYLDPLKTLGYGTGSGAYLGPVDGGESLLAR